MVNCLASFLVVRLMPPECMAWGMVFKIHGAGVAKDGRLGAGTVN